MRKATKRFKILDIYKEDPKTPLVNICALTNSTELYVRSVIADYHTQLVSYYDVHMAPSLSDDNTFYLFTENGEEKKFKIQQLLQLNTMLLCCKCGKKYKNKENCLIQV